MTSWEALCRLHAQVSHSVLVIQASLLLCSEVQTLGRKQVFSIHTLVKQFGPKRLADVWDWMCSLDLSSQVPLTLIPRARLPGSLLAMLGLCM